MSDSFSQTWFTLTFKNDVNIIKKANEMHGDLVTDLKNVISINDFTLQSVFQPWPTLFAEHSVKLGGNVTGLDQVKENALLWLVVGTTETAEEHKLLREKVEVMSATLEEHAKSNGLNVDWRYINYVDETQDPLGSYGPRNVDFLRKVAAKYDPDSVFQMKFVSGWKISDVKV